MPSPPLHYRLLMRAIYPLITLMYLWQSWQRREPRLLLQRLGFRYPTAVAQPLWLHCASVGEVRAALPLIDQLRQDPALSPLWVSTATPTGADALAQQQWQDVQHVYLPIDTRGAARRAFKAIKPRALIIMETELWPELIHTLRKHKRPVVVINARLSARTLGAPRWLKNIYRQTLASLTAVLAKSAQDAENFQKLGALPGAVHTLGNLKFAGLATDASALDDGIGRPYWLAASTHEDEELQLCRLLNQLPDCHLLVIAPRHPRRSAKIQQQLGALPLKLAVRSLDQPIDSDTQVYLADTLGEMPRWLQHADAVFMGGSLVPIGGHNLIEAAAVGAPQVSGPHLQNFEEEAALLTPSGALQVAADAAEAIECIGRLLADLPAAQGLGQSGKDALQGNQGILPDYLQALSRLVGRD